MKITDVNFHLITITHPLPLIKTKGAITEEDLSFIQMDRHGMIWISLEILGHPVLEVMAMANVHFATIIGLETVKVKTTKLGRLGPK